MIRVALFATTVIISSRLSRLPVIRSQMHYALNIHFEVYVGLYVILMYILLKSTTLVLLG